MEFGVGDLVVVKEGFGALSEGLEGLIGEVTLVLDFHTPSYHVDFGDRQGEILMYERELDRY